MHYHGRTIWHFLSNGLVSGFMCGLLFGTLLFPFGAQFITAPIGGFAGTVIGILLGIAIAIYNKAYFKFDTDITLYRRTLTRDAGIGAAVLLAIALSFPFILKPEYIAWGDWLRYQIPSLLAWTGIISLPSALMAGMAAAYTTHRYANKYADWMTKQKRDVEMPFEEIRRLPNRAVFGFFMLKLLINAKWVMGLFVVGTSILYFLGANRYSPIETAVVTSFGVGFLALITMFGQAFVIACLNEALIAALNRVYFNEYHPDMPLATYKHQLGWFSAITTLVYCVIITGGVFAPVAAVFAAITAQQYAEYRYESPEKAKRKAKHGDADIDRVQRLAYDEQSSETTSETLSDLVEDVLSIPRKTELR